MFFYILTQLVFGYKECWEAEGIPLKAIKPMNYSRERRKDKDLSYPGNKVTRTSIPDFKMENCPSYVSYNTLRRQFEALQDNQPMSPKANTRTNTIL